VEISTIARQAEAVIAAAAPQSPWLVGSSIPGRWDLIPSFFGQPQARARPRITPGRQPLELLVSASDALAYQQMAVLRSRAHGVLEQQGVVGAGRRVASRRAWIEGA